MIGVLIVVYRPRLPELAAALDAVRIARDEGVPIAAHLWHNDEGAARTEGLQAVYDRLRQAGLPLTIGGGMGNLGFGRGMNTLAAQAAEPFLLVLNQDAVPEPGSLHGLWRTARDDAVDVAAWEMRQIPYEHPKDYDPVTLETGWCSGAAVLLRAQAFHQMEGFEPRIFMYCEDVDLSWRLRCKGWRLRYLPQCAVVHRTYAVAGEIKPLQALGGAYANLCLRARFGAATHVKDSLAGLLRALRGPQPFAGYRAGLAKALLKFARNAAYFRRTRCAGPTFQPCFNGMDYEARREGAFHPFLPLAEQPQPRSLVTLLVVSHGRPEALRRMLGALAHQTHRPLEVVVAAGGQAVRATCEAFADRLDLRHLPAAEPSPAQALRAAVALARGTWIALADDEDSLPYADHIEVLLQAAEERHATAARALAWPIDAYFGDAPVPNRFHCACIPALRAPCVPGAALFERRRLAARLAATPDDPRAAFEAGDEGMVVVAKTTSIVRPAAAERAQG